MNLRLICFFLSFLILLFPIPLLHAEAPIKIGEINPLSGYLAKHGYEIHQGILYAVEEVNKQGGLAARRVELLSRDDRSSPEVAINQAQELLFREKVVGLVGGYVDSLVGPVSELAARYRIPYVASASLQRALTVKRKNPFFSGYPALTALLGPAGHTGKRNRRRHLRG